MENLVRLLRAGDIAETVLLGAIPLEGMDLMVNPVTQELVGAHGDEVEFLIL